MGQKRKPMADINVVPYIDVMLVLLIIFMVTAPMLTQGVKVDLPKNSDQPLPIKELDDQIIVSVNVRGEYFIEHGDKDPKPDGLDTVAGNVKKIVAVNPRASVLVRGDQKVEYRFVMDLISALNNGGVASVGLVTEAP